MLSRFSLWGGQSFKKCVFKIQPASAITTSAVASSGDVAKKDNPPPSKYPPEYPPATSKRDHVNFPRPSRRDRAPPVRLGFVPESWFQFFYPKTGYTGPYMLMASFGTYLYSKEIIVNEHNTLHCYSFMFLLIIVHNKLGHVVRKLYTDMIQEEADLYDGAQEGEKKVVKDNITFLENQQSAKDGIIELTKARTDVVLMQMEIAFRERMSEAYKLIKSKLDCQAELENVERRIAHKNVLDFVLKNVMQSITPDLEKNVLQTCINDLNALAAKA